MAAAAHRLLPDMNDPECPCRSDVAGALPQTLSLSLAPPLSSAPAAYHWRCSPTLNLPLSLPRSLPSEPAV